MLNNKEKMSWYAIIVTTIIVFALVALCIFDKNRNNLTEAFTFFVSVLTIVFGAGVFNKIKNDK
jgi:prolipoprotein diacylglyceryltransferase